jgi:hypothetical protein
MYEKHIAMSAPPVYVVISKDSLLARNTHSDMMGIVKGKGKFVRVVNQVPRH